MDRLDIIHALTSTTRASRCRELANESTASWHTDTYHRIGTVALNLVCKADIQNEQSQCSPVSVLVSSKQPFTYAAATIG